MQHEILIDISDSQFLDLTNALEIWMRIDLSQMSSSVCIRVSKKWQAEVASYHFAFLMPTQI